MLEVILVSQNSCDLQKDVNPRPLSNGVNRTMESQVVNEFQTELRAASGAQRRLSLFHKTRVIYKRT